MQSLKSKEFVSERFAWRHYYWFLTDEGIEHLREVLALPADIVPATLKKSTRALERDARGRRRPRPRRPRRPPPPPRVGPRRLPRRCRPRRGRRQGGGTWCLPPLVWARRGRAGALRASGKRRCPCALESVCVFMPLFLCVEQKLVQPTRFQPKPKRRRGQPGEREGEKVRSNPLSLYFPVDACVSLSLSPSARAVWLHIPTPPRDTRGAPFSVPAPTAAHLLLQAGAPLRANHPHQRAPRCGAPRRRLAPAGGDPAPHEGGE